MKNVVRQTGILFALVLLCAAGTAHSAGIDILKDPVKGIRNLFGF